MPKSKGARRRAPGKAPRPAAIVTGGASGIGLACAERLIATGWRVGLIDRDEKALARARKHFADEVRMVAGDVSDEPAMEKTIKAMAAAFGRLDGIVNSAGIAADVPVLDTPIDLFRKVIEVNLVGTFIAGRAAARIMKKQGGGAIVNIASISGIRGGKGRAAYGSSKGGVINLTKVMAVDLARYGIRVNAVAPGPVDTPLVQAVHTPQVRRAYMHHTPMRRYATPDEIAAAILFLLDGAQSSYVTGTILPVDGGFSGAGMMELKD